MVDMLLNIPVVMKIKIKLLNYEMKRISDSLFLKNGKPKNNKQPDTKTQNESNP